MANSAWLPEPPFESGGGGLVSTIDDYFAFSRMMLNKGRHGREQILSRAAVELMTSDQLTPEQRAGSEIFFGTHSSWGFGMAVDIQRKTSSTLRADSAGLAASAQRPTPILRKG